MATIPIPYAQTHLDLRIADNRLAGILESKAHHYQPSSNQEDLVRQALASPIGSPRLRDLARGKNKIVIVTSDAFSGKLKFFRNSPKHMGAPFKYNIARLLTGESTFAQIAS